MIVAVLLLLLAIVVASVFRLWCSTKTTSPPPSPKEAWPIFGHFFQLDSKQPYKTMTNWAKTCGPVYQIQLIRQKALVLNNVSVIKEAYSGRIGEILSGRPFIPVELAYSGGEHGIINTVGQVWHQQRNFAIQVLKQFGSASMLEDIISQETGKLLQAFEEHLDAAFDPVPYLHLCSTNIISTMIMSETFESGDMDLHKIDAALELFMKVSVRSVPVQHFPILQYLVPGAFGLKKVFREFEEIRNQFLRQKVEKQKALIEEETTQGKPAANFIQAYLKEIQQRKEKSAPLDSFCERELFGSLLDLYAAGQHTIKTSLSWALIYIVRYTEVQKLMQSEIDENVAAVPNWSDRLRLPYTMACLTEVMRCSTLVPISVFHKAQKIVEFRGITVEKGTWIIANIWAAHNDDRLFPKPSEFRPERFLDPETGNLVRTENVIPFATGKRVCLGENLARVELFLILTSILYHYTLLPSSEDSLPSFEPIPGLVETPHAFQITLQRRLCPGSSTRKESGKQKRFSE